MDEKNRDQQQPQFQAGQAPEYAPEGTAPAAPAEQARQSHITLMPDMFTARPDGGGEEWQAVGITTIVDGWLRQFFDTVKGEMPELPEDIDVFRTILFAGMDEMRRQLDARRVEQDL